MTIKIRDIGGYIKFLANCKSKIAQMTACIYAQNIAKNAGLNIAKMDGSYVSSFKNEAGDNIKVLFTYKEGYTAKYDTVYHNSSLHSHSQPSKNMDKDLNLCIDKLGEIIDNAHYSKQKALSVASFITNLLNEQDKFFAQLWQGDLELNTSYRITGEVLASGTRIQMAIFNTEGVNTESPRQNALSPYKTRI